MMEISFDYLWTDVAANADGDFIVYIYDVDNGVLIQPVGYEIFRSGFKSQHKATFQTDATSDDYRVIFHVAQDRAGVYSLKVDNLYVGPQRGGVSGAVITDMGSYSWTPVVTYEAGSNSPTFTTLTGIGARHGDTFKGVVRMNVSVLTANAGFFTLSLPPGLVADSSKSGAGIWTNIGYAQSPASGTIDVGSTNITPKRDSGANGHFRWETVVVGTEYSFEFSVPILGWSSNTVMSEDAGNREIVGKFALTTAANHTTLSGWQKVPVATVRFDTVNGWDATNTRYVIQETGYYDVDFGSGFGAIDVQKSFSSAIYVNGSPSAYGSDVAMGALNAGRSAGASILYLTKGQYVELYAFQNDSSSEAYSLALNSNSFSIAKRSSPVTIAASEKVYAEYRTDTSPIITGTFTAIDFEDKVTDSHGAVATGVGWKFTAPRAGVYKINISLVLFMGMNTFDGISDLLRLELYKNGSTLYRLDTSTIPPSITYTTIRNGISTYLDKGDYIQVFSQQDSGTDISLTNINTQNWITIVSE
jgi:hypothetical protein